MKANYKEFLQKNCYKFGHEYKPHTFTILMPPITKKMLDRITNHGSDKNDGKLKSLNLNNQKYKPFDSDHAT